MNFEYGIHIQVVEKVVKSFRDCQNSMLFVDRSVNKSGFLGEVSIELSFLVLPISYSS